MAPLGHHTTVIRIVVRTIRTHFAIAFSGMFVVFFVGTFIHPFNHLGVFIFRIFIFVFLYRRLICDRNATGFSLKRQNNFFIRYFPFKKVSLLREEILAGRYFVEFYFTILGLDSDIQFCET